MEGRYRALRQTPNKSRGQWWILEHRAVRQEMEKVWDTLADHQRRLDEALCKKMDAWDERHLAVSDNISIAGHAIEAMTRHREVDQAFFGGLPGDEPRVCFNAWWLRAYSTYASWGLGVSWIARFLD